MLPIARPRPEPLRSDLRARDESLASLGLLAGHLAHDFNNLLAPILGYSTLIKEEFSKDSSGQQFATSLETAARRAEKILEQTLLATRPQRRFSPQEHSFDQIIATETAKWQGEQPLTAGLSVQVQTVPCTLVVDDNHWRIALRHLLNNARFGCAIGGHITVSVEIVELTSAERHDLGLPEGPMIRLRITDDGFGMSPEILARAFEPFYTSRPKGAAQGLGLTACHSITYLHGGQIELISAPDQGTQVTIWLPQEFLTPKVVTPEPDLPARPKSSTGKRKRILMVDDDPLVREVIKVALVRAGYEVLTADDGQAAWKMYSRFHLELGAVLSDFRMPLMDGVQLLKQMRELNPGVPVLLLTGDVSGDLEQKLKEHHLWVNIIPKPCPLNKLIEQINDLPG
jgi:CheY-like chemotaxis protein